MSSLTTIAKNAVRGIQHRSPVILTGFAVAGVVSTVVLAVRVTPKAATRLESARGDGLPVKEQIRQVWALYIPAALTGASTIACIIGAQSINARRQAALIGAFTLTEGAFQEYKEQVVEALGKTKEEKVRADVVQKQVDNNPPDGVIVMGAGNVLCLDTYTGRYFESTMEKIRAAQNDFNESLIDGEQYLSLNELYHLLDLPDTVVGEQVGFAAENRLNIQFSTALTKDGRPCLAISFRALPRQDYTAMFQ